MTTTQFMNYIFFNGYGTDRPARISECRWAGMIRWAITNGFISEKSQNSNWLALTNRSILDTIHVWKTTTTQKEKECSQSRLPRWLTMLTGYPSQQNSLNGKTLLTMLAALRSHQATTLQCTMTDIRYLTTLIRIRSMLSRIIEDLTMWLLIVSSFPLAGIVYAGTCALLLGK